MAGLQGLKGSLKEAAIDKLAYDLQSHSFYKYMQHNNKVYPAYAHDPIEHPYPFKDEGIDMLIV